MNSERNASSADPSSWGAPATVVDEPEGSSATPNNESRDASRNSPHFYRDERVFCRAQQWAHDPRTFFRDVPQGCLACQLYKRIQALFSVKRKPCRPEGSKQPDEETLINTIELRIYLTQFSLLRSEFKAVFHDYAKDPLTSLLKGHGLAEEEDSLDGLGKAANKGMRYRDLADTTGHASVLLLSTTFKIEELENRRHLSVVSNTALEDIKHLTEMQLYDRAVGSVFGVFEKYRKEWLKSTENWQKQGVRAPVQLLVDVIRRGNLNQPRESCCNSQEGLELVCLPSSATQESANPAQTSLVAASEALPFVPPLSVVAEDIHGVRCCLDPNTVISLTDMSGEYRHLSVGALAQGSSTARTETAWNGQGSLSDILLNVAVYGADEYMGEIS